MLKSNNYDVVILGTGPAGLQAAIHAVRKKVSVLVLGKETKSSLFHAHVENFCCLFNVSGEDMLNVGRQQAVNFGSEMLAACTGCVGDHRHHDGGRIVGRPGGLGHGPGRSGQGQAEQQSEQRATGSHHRWDCSSLASSVGRPRIWTAGMFF